MGTHLLLSALVVPYPLRMQCSVDWTFHNSHPPPLHIPHHCRMDSTRHWDGIDWSFDAFAAAYYDFPSHCYCFPTRKHHPHLGWLKASIEEWWHSLHLFPPLNIVS